MIGTNASQAAQMIKGVTDAWSGMFDALGNDELSDTLGLVGELTGEIGNLVEGLTSGNPIQMATSTFSFIPNIIGSIARAHDKNLTSQYNVLNWKFKNCLTHIRICNL